MWPLDLPSSFLFPFTGSVSGKVGQDSILGIMTRTCWTVQESSPGGGKIFHNYQDQLFPHPLCSGYCVISGSKVARAWC
jgi:hypothetical protein